MSRKTTHLLGYGIEEEIDPTIKFNSLISVTVSTIMCLAARYPVPKSNVETTKLFLSTITDESGQIPRNIKDFLSLLNGYTGPYEGDSLKERCFDKTSAGKLLQVKGKNSSLENAVEAPTGTGVSSKESSPGPENHLLVKGVSKTAVKKGERESAKKANKNAASKMVAYKPVTGSKS